MIKVVYIYVYPSYTLTSLVEKVNQFYKAEFDENTHIYFVGVFTVNNKVKYNYNNEQKISLKNLSKINKQIFSSANNINTTKLYIKSNGKYKEKSISINIPHFLEKYKQKGEASLNNFKWSVDTIYNRFFILSGNLFENTGIHCDTIGTKRFLSQIHFLQNYNNKDIFCGIDFKTCIIRKQAIYDKYFERVSYGESINEILTLRSPKRNKFVLGLQKGSFDDPKYVDDEASKEVNSLYKMIVISKPALETTFYNPFLSSFKEDVYFLSNIPLSWCKKNPNLSACKFNSIYPNCSSLDLEMNQSVNPYFKQNIYRYSSYREYYPKYFYYLVYNFKKYGYTNNFVTVDLESNDLHKYVWFFFQKIKSSPLNGFTCEEVYKKAQDKSWVTYPIGYSTSKKITNCDAKFLQINESKFKDIPHSKCNFKTYKVPSFRLLYSFAENLKKHIIHEEKIQIENTQQTKYITRKNMLNRTDSAHTFTKKDHEKINVGDKVKRLYQLKNGEFKWYEGIIKKKTKERYDVQWTKGQGISKIPLKNSGLTRIQLKTTGKPKKLNQPKLKNSIKTIKKSKTREINKTLNSMNLMKDVPEKNNKSIINIGDKVEVKWELTNGKYDWFEAIIKNKTKEKYKVKFPNHPIVDIPLNSSEIRKL